MLSVFHISIQCFDITFRHRLHFVRQADLMHQAEGPIPMDFPKRSC